MDDVVYILDLVLSAFPRINVGNMDNGLLGRVEHFQDLISVRARVEVIADIELLQVLCAFARLVAGLDFKVAGVFVTSPTSATAMCILLV